MGRNRKYPTEEIAKAKKLEIAREYGRRKAERLASLDSIAILVWKNKDDIASVKEEVLKLLQPTFERLSFKTMYPEYADPEDILTE